MSEKQSDPLQIIELLVCMCARHSDERALTDNISQLIALCTEQSTFIKDLFILY